MDASLLLSSSVLASFAVASAIEAQHARPASPPSVLIDPDLAPPSALVAYPCGSSVELHWMDSSRAESSFVVRRRAGDAGPFDEVGLTGPDVELFLDADVPDGTYSYQVAARSGLLESLPSESDVVQLPNLPPTIAIDLDVDQHLSATAVLRFTVKVIDPEGDRVALRLLNPPPGMLFDPLWAAPSPAKVEVRWTRDPLEERHPRLVFEANCGVRLVQDVALGPFPVNRYCDTALTIGDVTDDGILDAVIASEHAGAEDTGAIYVFAGSPSLAEEPRTILKVSGDSLRPRNRYREHLVQLADVTGDGELDVVSGSLSQRVYVWAGGGGMSGVPAPTAILSPPGTSGDFIAAEDPVAPLVQLIDIDGDGVDDIVTFDRFADVGSVVDAGAVFLWLGGSDLEGTRTPSRVLTVPGASSGDWYGRASWRGDSILLADLTGDEVLDFLVSAPRADLDGAADAGAVFVWSGKAVIAGNTAPTEILVTPGHPRSLGEMLVGDLSGDGILDVIAGWPFAPVSGLEEVGLYHLWRGGGWTGTRSPDATFRVPGAPQYQRLGLEFAGVAEVTGDGKLDFVTLSSLASFDGVRAGAIHVWRGASTHSGLVPPTATLGVDGAHEDDLLGTLGDSPALQLEDVDGDHVLDLVSGTFVADDGGVHDTGAVYVWRGGALTGVVHTTAILSVPGAAPSTHLTQYSGIGIDDLDGDGQLDLRAAAPGPRHETPGTIHVWSGASGFGGRMSPDCSLTHESGGRISLSQTIDLDGDGHSDLLVQGLDNPRLFFWRGGPDFFTTRPPDAVLRGGGERRAYHVDFADLDHDGIQDVAATYSAAGFHGRGQLQIWRGRQGLSGTPAASSTLLVPNARQYDALGTDGLRLADLTGDGQLELLSISPLVDLSPTLIDAGALYAWSAALLIPGSNPPLASMRAPDAEAYDRLGDCTRDY